MWLVESFKIENQSYMQIKRADPQSPVKKDKYPPGAAPAHVSARLQVKLPEIRKA